MSKIAILTDSTSDISQELAKEKGIYLLPLKINYKDRQYTDGIDITSEEVYSRLEQEVPTTSLPSGEDIEEVFAKIKADGYTEVMGIHLSSGLSGTFNFINIVASDIEDMNIKLFDTKNIAMGLGLTVLSVAEFAKDETKTLDEVYEYTEKIHKNSKIYFSLNTFEYLLKGGRVGKVSAVLGAKLNLKPVISCNDDGVYHTVAKAIGRTQSLKKVVELAESFANQGASYNVCVSHSHAFEEASKVLEIVKSKFTNAKNIYMTNITPVLGVHAGPGLIGVGVELL